VKSEKMFSRLDMPDAVSKYFSARVSNAFLSFEQRRLPVRQLSRLSLQKLLVFSTAEAKCSCEFIDANIGRVLY